MLTLPDQPRSYSDGYIDSENEFIEESFGWNDDSESNFDLFTKNKNLSSKLIEKANNHLSLNSLFKQYPIKFTTVESPSGWTKKAICPFPNHKDHTPSFGYNPTEDRFNCFGCQKGGRSVNFVFYMQGGNGNAVDIAKKFLGNSLQLEELLIDCEEQDNSQIQILLMDFSTFFRNFIKNQENKSEAIIWAESATWNLEVYLRKNNLPGAIIVTELAARIEKIKIIINDFGEKS